MHPQTPPPRPISVRQADLHLQPDCEAISHLVNAYAHDPLGIGGPLPEATLCATIAGLREHPACLVLLAEIDGRAAGLAVCFFGFSTFAGRKLLNIHDLAVLPEYRRQGIATRLLDQAAVAARQNDCCKVTLEVRSDNAAAKSLYRRCGFSSGAPPYEFWGCPL
jgi:ribosomal protein S18 acetylase RimI-like enzyme